MTNHMTDRQAGAEQQILGAKQFLCRYQDYAVLSQQYKTPRYLKNAPDVEVHDPGA